MLAAGILALAGSLQGCRQQPTEVQLATWQQEALMRNATLAAAHLHNPQTQTQSWRLLVTGQTLRQTPVTLTWQQLQSLATSRVLTQSPLNPTELNAVLDFQGIGVADLLKQVGVKPGVQEVTFVTFDAFRSTVNLDDLQRYPITLALKRNGQFIQRNQGGPVFLVFPYRQYPQLEQVYSDKFWSYYVTHVIVGTEPIQLRLKANQQEYRFEASALAKLPQTSLEEAVEYRLGWPVGKVKLQGVRLRDLLAAAGVSLQASQHVVVRGKAAVDRDLTQPVTLSADAVNRCDLLLATHWGDDRQPIPARLGGPVTLALPHHCVSQNGVKGWMTFVEELEVPGR
ncbi:molybdopterin-dependent oxidoreductase [Leptolyngbya sp. FACHB-261]|uniref:molybdopterin-dependent oxidoreductase n=1 Tax=Leptolyngbya sp. FACHB-261 TaxID=2692806 RepID=UPI0018F05587|nr:molybdopterin-dependent oxidoreductase [Leptolyngbya sp. FACHB-261]